ncbi:MAG: outer membrane beta-barrel protein [Niveispirillum sp.]|uniref:outer membrane beta-barrel protein n=1 Tax=Niveispirillum sp. TaxID=1917217 RepID=UPI003BA72B18
MLQVPMNGPAGRNVHDRLPVRGGFLLAIGVLALCAPLAQAQTQPAAKSNAAPITQENNTASDEAGSDDSDRVNESYQPKGLEAGSFLFFPKIEVDGLYNSNVFAQEMDKKSDTILRISPDFQFRSRFTRHELNIAAKADRYIYDTYSSDNRTDLSTNIDGRLDIERSWEATLNLDAYKRGEDRGSPDAVAGVKPTPTYGMTANVGTRKEQGRFVFAANGKLSRRTYDNVETSTNTVVNNHDRDRWEYVGQLRGEYAVYDVVSIVGVGELNQRDYDDRLDDNGYARSSNGFRLETGVSVDISQIIKGDITAGYFEQDYDDARFTSPSGFAFRARLNWTPSRMTVVVPSLEREVDETISQNVSSLVRTSGGVLVRHELQRNLVLTASGNVRHEKYEGTSERAWNYETRLRGTYAFSPEFFTAGEVAYRDRNSTRVNSSYEQWTMLLRVGARI